MFKAAIYARYSSDNQREESIEAQIRAIQEYADTKGFTIVKIYTDEALSAKTDNRPQFLQMISDAKKHMFDGIICHKLDRFARNRYDSAFYKRILKENNVRLISVLEHFDDSPESIILESVLEGMAEYYSANLSREVMKGMKENALSCRHTGGKPAFGYDVGPDHKYIINEKEAAAIRYIFKAAVNGHSAGEIIQWLNNGGYTTKYDTTFTSSAINAIIRNEKYKGVYVYGKTKRKVIAGRMVNEAGSDTIRVPGGVPRLVDDDTWNAANKIYDKRKYKSGGQAKAKEIYLLSGLIECGLCGGAMCGNKVNSNRDGSARITYLCSTRKAKKECRAKDIRRDVAEGIVLDEVERLLSERGIEKMVDYLIKKIEKLSREMPKEIKDLKKKLVANEKQINRLVDALLSGVSSDTIKHKINALESEKNDIIARIEYYEDSVKVSSIPRKDHIRAYLRKDMDIKNKGPDDQKRIIKTYIQKVTVYPDHIEIFSEMDTTSGAEPYIVVSISTYTHEPSRGLYYKHVATKLE